VVLQEVKDKLNRGEAVDLAAYDIHVAAVLFKMFFRDLPSPVFPEAVVGSVVAMHGVRLALPPAGRRLTGPATPRRAPA
jgi:hypothetical protein